MSELLSGSPCISYNYYESTDGGPPIQQIDPRIFGDFGSSPIQTPEQMQALLNSAQAAYNNSVPPGYYHISEKPEVANAIIEAAKKYDVSPLAILGYLQKESASLSTPKPIGGMSEQWATGCGYTDSGEMEEFAGLTNQINCTAATLAHKKEYFNQHYADTGVDMEIDGHHYHITDPNTYAALMYTPHVDMVNGYNDTVYTVVSKSYNQMMDGSPIIDPCKHLFKDSPDQPSDDTVQQINENSTTQHQQNLQQGNPFNMNNPGNRINNMNNDKKKSDSVNWECPG